MGELVNFYLSTDPERSVLVFLPAQCSWSQLTSLLAARFNLTDQIIASVELVQDGKVAEIYNSETEIVRSAVLGSNAKYVMHLEHGHEVPSYTASNTLPSSNQNGKKEDAVASPDEPSDNVDEVVEVPPEDKKVSAPVTEESSGPDQEATVPTLEEMIAHRFDPEHDLINIGYEGDSLHLLDYIEKFGITNNEKLARYAFLVSCAYGRLTVAQLLRKFIYLIDEVDGTGNTSLHYAIQGRHVETVAWLIREGASLYSLNSAGWTPLHFMCLRGLIELAPFIPKKAINLASKNGTTLLHCAVMEGHHSMIEHLILNEANVAARNYDQTTALHFACQDGKLDIARALVDHGAAVNTSNIRGESPLLLACRGGYYDLVKWLYSQGANVYVEDGNGNTALHAACSSGNLGLVKWLISVDLDVDARNFAMMSPMDIANEHGHKAIASYFIHRDPEMAVLYQVPAVESNTEEIIAKETKQLPPTSSPTPPTLSAPTHPLPTPPPATPTPPASSTRDMFEGVTHVTSMFTNMFSAPTKSPAKTATPAGSRTLSQTFIDAIVRNDMTYIVTTLVHHPENLTAADAGGNLPMHIATIQGHADLLMYLLQQDEKLINATNTLGLTCLHLACSYNDEAHETMVVELVQKGADVTLLNSNGLTPLHVLASNSNVRLWEALAEMIPISSYLNIPSQMSILHLVCEAGNGDLFAWLLDHGANALAADSQNRTPLSYASRKGHVEIVEAIYDHLDKHKISYDVNAGDAEGKTPLIDSCINGNLKISKMHVYHGASVTVKNARGNTPLHAACQSGEIKLVRWLVNIGADVNAVNNKGHWPIDFATVGNFEEIVAYLREKGSFDRQVSDDIKFYIEEANVDALKQLCVCGVSFTDVIVEDDGKLSSAIQYAAKCGSIASLQYFSESSYPLHELDRSGLAPVHYAAMNGQVKVLEWLYQKGENMELPSLSGKTALHFAAGCGHPEVIRWLGSLGNINASSQDTEGCTPMHDGAVQDNAEVLAALVEIGAAVDAPDLHGRTALHACAVTGHLSNANLLLEYQHPIDVVDESGLTPFLHVCSVGNHEGALWCLEHGANIRHCGTYGEALTTALHIAAHEGHMDIVKWLVECGVDVGVANANGNTAAEVAAHNGHEEIATWLTNEGENYYPDRIAVCVEPQLFWALNCNYFSLAQALVRDIYTHRGASHVHPNGSNLMHTAGAAGDVSLLGELFSNGADLHHYADDCCQPIHYAMMKGNIAAAQAMIILGASAVEAGMDGNTILHIAADNGNVEAVQLAMEHFSSLNVTNEFGWTPMHYACCFGHYEIIELLLSGGASATIAAHENVTPLHLAVDRNHIDIVRLLINDGSVDVNAKTFSGYTPYSVAASLGFSQIADWLARLAGANISIGTMLQVEKKKSSFSIFACVADTNEKAAPKITQFFDAPATSPHPLVCNVDMAAVNAKLAASDAPPHDMPSENDSPIEKMRSASEHLEKEHVEIISTSLTTDSEDVTYIDKTLFNACESGDVAIVENLVASGADVNSVNLVNHGTPLHIACVNGNLPLVEYLIDQGAKLNAQNVGGMTPLHVACDRQFHDIVMYLIKKGADLMVANKAGNAPLHLMCSRGMLDTLRAVTDLPRSVVKSFDINSVGGHGFSVLHYAIAANATNNTELVELLLRLRTNVNAKNDDSQTALHFACSTGNFTIAKMLLGAGADVNIVDSLGRSALYFACVVGNIQLVHDIIARGGDIHVKTTAGDSLLHVACQHGRLVLSKLLYQHGLKLLEVNDIGKTAHDLAYESGNAVLINWVDGLNTPR